MPQTQDNTKVTTNQQEMNFHELFSPDTVVEIPLFQREYVWTEKQWKRMIREIDAIYEGKDQSRFLGAVISVKKITNASEPNNYEIVDGQQRITTLFIFLLATIYVAAKNGNHTYAKTLINKYAVIDWWNEINTSLITGYKDRKQFNKIFQQLFNAGELTDWLSAKTNLPVPTGEDDGRFWKQYERIRKLLQRRYHDQGEEYLEEISNVAITKLTFVFITLVDPSNATKVFEGLNDPGIPIGIGDLVRNEVFSKISSEPERAIQIHTNVWLPFRDKLGNYYDKYFFPYAIIFKSSVNQSNLFRGLREIWGEVDEPNEIIQKLNEYVVPYLAIVSNENFEIYPRSIRNQLSLMREINAPTSMYPFVMKLLKEYEKESVSEDVVIQCLSTLESFLVRRAICGIEPTGLLVFFRTAWSVLNGEPTKINIIEALKQRTTIANPNDELVETSVKTRPIYKTRIINYLLQEYEKSLVRDQWNYRRR